MSDVSAPKYVDTLAHALLAWKDWLEKSEIFKLKEELRLFQISFSVLYNILLKKKLIHEDPYKQETKISDLEIPEAGPIPEAKKMEQISLRLSNYDNQLDFLVNFYQFGVDFLNLERIRRIVGLIRYIDWINFSPDSPSYNTKFFSEITNSAKSNIDSINLSIIGESLSKLPKSTAVILGILKNISIYHKETYKLNVRNAIKNMHASEANVVNYKKKMASIMPGSFFYSEFIEELIREDFSKDSQSLRDAVLKTLTVAEAKPKVVKPKIDYKAILMSGIQAVGSAAIAMNEIAEKINENKETLENQKKGIWQKIRKLLRSIMHSDAEDIIYELQYFDPAKGTQTREDLNFLVFQADFDKKTKILNGLNGQSTLIQKLGAMQEDQILNYLERNIRDIQSLYKTLVALDEFFKSSLPKSEREKIRGIKPELASVKNCIVKANQLRHDYSAFKEEEEQLKRLGVSTGA
ncbi:MAG: hypothetical protein FWH41_03950 [Treponema sp.]|nr:hypothetical protein [Treponema sp.]